MTNTPGTTFSHRFTSFFVVLFVTVLSLAILDSGADAAKPRPVEVIARPTDANTLAVKVRSKGAIERVGLYVDGTLRGVDRSAPWTFGNGGRIQVGAGRRAIAVVARDHGARIVVHKSVVVGNQHSSRSGSTGTATGDPTLGGPSSGNSGGGHSRPVVEKEQTIPPAVSEDPPLETTEPPAEASSPLAPQGTEGQILWRGDYSTGDLSQWETNQSVEANRIQVVSNPVAPGNQYSARFETRPTDNIGDTSPRSELAENLGEKEGEERWYRWYTYFPENFPVQYPEQFITFTQWRALDESEAYGSFMVLGDTVTLRQEGIGTLWEAPLTLGVWHKFVFHVKWSPNPNEGFYELYYDGHLVMQKRFLKTMSGTPGHAVGNYMKEGLYKSEFIPTGVLYQDGLVVGTSYNAVNEAP